jgi:hypothetical protein
VSLKVNEVLHATRLCLAALTSDNTLNFAFEVLCSQVSGSFELRALCLFFNLIQDNFCEFRAVMLFVTCFKEGWELLPEGRWGDRVSSWTELHQGEETL